MLCLRNTEWMHVGLTKRVGLTLQLVKQKEAKVKTISQVPLAHDLTLNVKLEAISNIFKEKVKPSTPVTCARNVLITSE